MKAAYFLPDRRAFEINEFPEDPLPDGCARVRVRAVGICGSDSHSVESCEMGGVAIVEPYVLGHEFAGVVEALAEDVQQGPVAVGDLVAVDPQLPCGRCPFCLAGRSNICPHMSFMGGYPCPGALRERVVVPARNLYRVPDGLGLDAAVMAEPLTVALHSVRLAGPLCDRTVGVIGAGPIGNLVLQCARLQTGEPILVSEPIPERRALAQVCGATECFDPREVEPDALRRRFPDGYGPDVVFEATRTGEGLRAALELVRPGGRVVYIGIADDPVAVTTSVPRRKEVTLQWVRRSLGGYLTGLRLMADGRIRTQPLVTHHAPLTDTGRTVETVIAYRDGVFKAMIDVTCD